MHELELGQIVISKSFKYFSAFVNSLLATVEEVSSSSGPTDVMSAERSFPRQMWTSRSEELMQSNDFNTICKVGSTKPLNIGPPLTAMVVNECKAHIWTCGDAVSCAKAKSMETDVCKC